MNITFLAKLILLHSINIQPKLLAVKNCICSKKPVKPVIHVFKIAINCARNYKLDTSNLINHKNICGLT